MTVRTRRNETRSNAASDWMRDNLPQERFSITDLDFVLVNHRARRFALVETKHNGETLTRDQREIFWKLDQQIRAAPSVTGYDYRGCFVVYYSEPFSGGQVYEITAPNHPATFRWDFGNDELKKFLSLEVP
jgi:hypothetical protein